MITFRFKKKFVVAFVVLVVWCVLYEIKNHFFTNCNANEPIDVVYTWVNGSEKRFRNLLYAYLIKEKGFRLEASDQRFDDKNELKYSLRSLEKYAPWVHHVYIVTNGQIPYWLNLDYPKVTLIAHEEIFSDLSHLPTFSSPAIETHLHRIRGLSKKFIYFNDDIFLNSPIYPEDFYTNSAGYMIHLAYFIPPCSTGCSWLSVADGHCDQECNTEICEYDGGDCYFKNLENAGLIDNDVEDSKQQSMELDETQILSSNNIMYNRILIDLINSSRLNVSSFTPPIRSTAFQNYISNHSNNFFLNKLIYSTNLTNLIGEHNQVFFNEKENRPLKRVKRSELTMKQFFENVRKNDSTLDAYGGSLQHTNRILNLQYGYELRHIPSHAPIMINRVIMAELQHKFQKEFQITSSNRFRNSNDIQYAFMYYHYIINQQRVPSVDEIFQDFDIDNSGIWSPLELKLLLPNLVGLPVSEDNEREFNDVFENCAKEEAANHPVKYIFSRSHLPEITRSLVVNCGHLSKLLTEKFHHKQKYNYQVFTEDQFTMFHMIKSNISEVKTQLDEIRTNRKKFVCLNDDLDPIEIVVNNKIKLLMQDLYQSLFPLPSKFELNENERNEYEYKFERTYHFEVIYKQFEFQVFCAVTYFSVGLAIYLYPIIRRIINYFVIRMFY